MGNETEEALAELPEMTASDQSRLGESADSDADEGPSAEVLAEAAAAERDAQERGGRAASKGAEAASGSVGDSSTAAGLGDESAEAGPDGNAELAAQASDAITEESTAQGADGTIDETSAQAGDGTTAQAADARAEESSAQGADGTAAESTENPVDDAAEGPGALLSDSELRRVLCALLFASPEALSEARLAQLAEGPPKARVKAALTQLEAELAEGPFPLELRKLAGGWRLMTAAEMSDVVARLFQARKSERLSAAGLETLAVVAYRQPVTKADIEAIRGVQCGPMLRTLVDRGLVKVTGRADLPGGPLQYGTTRDFLDRFGLGGLEELPRDGELLG